METTRLPIAQKAYTEYFAPKYYAKEITLKITKRKNLRKTKRGKNESLTFTLFLAMTWCMKMKKNKYKCLTTYDGKLFAKEENSRKFKKSMI